MATTIFINLFWGLLLLFNSPFWADVPGDERFSVESWGIADGLPVNTLNRIEQGDEGYLWITSYEGIIRFDGHRFTVFNSTNRLK